jgi:hypothetical protein
MADQDFVDAPLTKEEQAQFTDSPIEAPRTGLQQYWDKHPNMRRAARGTLDTLPVAGALVGGSPGAISFMAAPLSGGTSVPVSAAVTAGGAALGAGAGRGLRDLIAEHLGIEDPTSPMSKGARIALDTAITGATPFVASKLKDILAKPTSSLVDFLNIYLHPLNAAREATSTMGEMIEAAHPTLPRVASELPQAEWREIPGHGWTMVDQASKAPLAEGTVANVGKASGEMSVQTARAMTPPLDADIRAAKLFMSSGLSASQAATKAANGNMARYVEIMSGLGK